MNEASYFQLLDMVEEAIRTAADDSLGPLVEQLRQGAIPRETIEAALQQFDGVFYETLAGAYSQVLGTTMGVQAIKSIEVGGLKLSTAMYGHGKAVTAEVLGIINRHAKGMQSARKLALEIYEGYGFRDPAAEPLKLSPRNHKLPKYLREVLRDDDARTAMQRIIARAQATEIKTPNLRAAYVQAIDEFEKGAGADRLAKVLDVAANERMRYFANRIAQTELHRAYSDQQAREFMAEPALTVLQWRMSATHPKADVCFRAGTVVATSQGDIPIEAVSEGDIVLTHKGRWRRVTRVYCSPLSAGDRLLDILVKTESGESLQVVLTPNHPVLTPSGWIQASGLQKGCFVVVAPESSRFHLFGGGEYGKEPSDSGESLTKPGLKSGDGQRCDAPQDQFLYGRFRTPSRCFEAPISVRSFGCCTFQHLEIRPSSSDFLLPDAVQTACGGNLPNAETCQDDAFQSSDSLLQLTNIACCNSASHNLTKEMICDRTGIEPFGTHKSNISEPEIGSEMWFCNDGICSESYFKSYIKTGMISSVSSIHSAGESVFNLGVEEDNSYIAEGIVVHNCDMHANLNKYGLGPGCYPKELAPKPPAHPFCRCKLVPRWDLKKAAARDRAKAEQAFLIEAGDRDGAKIMGSRAKWIAAKNGTPVDEILNSGKDPMYRLARVGDDF